MRLRLVAIEYKRVVCSFRGLQATVSADVIQGLMKILAVASSYVFEATAASETLVASPTQMPSHCLPANSDSMHLDRRLFTSMLLQCISVGAACSLLLAEGASGIGLRFIDQSDMSFIRLTEYGYRRLPYLIGDRAETTQSAYEQHTSRPNDSHKF